MIGQYRYLKGLVLSFVLGAAALLGIWNPVPEARAQGQIFVSNYGADTVTTYARTATGNTPPGLVIPTQHGPHQIAINHIAHELLVANFLSNSVTVHDYSTGALKRTISGAATTLSGPAGIAVDETNLELYVSNFSSNTVAVFALSAGGNVAPLRAIGGTLSRVSGPVGVAVDPANGEVVVGMSQGAFGGAIHAYSRLAQNEGPLRLIQGPSTGLNAPEGLVVDAAHNEIVVANSGYLTPNVGSILVFSRIDNGDRTPLRRLEGPSTKLCNPTGLAINLADDELIVPNTNTASQYNGGAPTGCDQSVTTYSRTANGDTAPLRVITQGSLSGLSIPAAIALILPPKVTSVVGPAVPQAVGTSVSITATFTDAVVANHTCNLSWGDGASSNGVIQRESSATAPGTCTGSHTYTVAGVYSVVANVANEGVGSGTSSAFTVFDNDSSIIGTGKILSPTGAYRPSPTLSGPAQFAFVAKSRKILPGGIVLFKFGKFKLIGAGTSVVFTSPNVATLTGLALTSTHTKKHSGDDDCDDDSHFTAGVGLATFKLVAKDGGLAGNAGDTFRLTVTSINPAVGLIYDNGTGSPLIDGKIEVK